MKISLLIACFLLAGTARAQELFVFTEPASNMPVKSFAVRVNNVLSRQKNTGKYSYAFAAEVMIGVSKKLMFHAEVFSGNNPDKFTADGASLYAKYRFYTEDEVHSHFRLSAYGKLAASGNDFRQPAIQLGERNSGAEAGAVATKLQRRAAYSAGISFVRAFENNKGNLLLLSNAQSNAVNYNVSFGRLLLPVLYENYEQTNMNGMVELLGQINTGTGNTFIDLAPSIQLIFLSRIRLDAGYRFPVVHSLQRYADKSFLLRLEYNFFSALNKRHDHRNQNKKYADQGIESDIYKKEKML